MKKIVFLILILVASFTYTQSSKVFAAMKTSTYSCNLSLIPTDWTRDCVIPQFDSALGNLLSVEVSSSVSIIGNLGVENVDTAPHTITTTFSGQVTIRRPDNSTLLQVNPIGSSNVFDATAFDGTVDFGGDSGFTYQDLTAATSNQNIYTDNPTLSLFTGVGNLNLPVLAVGTSVSTGSGNIDTRYRTSAQADVSVVYTYQASNLSVTKTSSSSFIQGQTIEYSITVTNNDGEATNGNIIVTDNLPPEMTFVSATGNEWSCTETGYVITCTRSTPLGPNSSSTILLQAILNANSGDISNSVEVSGALPDDVPSNNTSTFVSTALPTPTSPAPTLPQTIPSPSGSTPSVLGLSNTGDENIVLVTLSGLLISTVSFSLLILINRKRNGCQT